MSSKDSGLLEFIRGNVITLMHLSGIGYVTKEDGKNSPKDNF